MLTPSSFRKQIAVLANASGLPGELASKYAALIGDTPGLADHGQLVVRDENGVDVARLPLHFAPPYDIPVLR